MAAIYDAPYAAKQQFEQTPTFSAPRIEVTEPCRVAGAEFCVDLNRVVENFHSLRRLSDKATCAAIVKGDGYGHGMTACAPSLVEAGARQFFVATLHDALLLCPLVGDAKIAVLGGVLPHEEDEFIAAGIVPVLNDLGQIERWCAAARRKERTLESIVHIDTGMNRLGIVAEDFESWPRIREELSSLEVSHVMSHLTAADDLDFESCERQRSALLFHAERFPGAKLSLANSAASFFGPEYRMDLFRPGKATFGINPIAGRPNPMATPAQVSAPLIEIKTVGRGEGIGYSSTRRLSEKSRIATVAIGYANGYPRSGGNRAEVAIAGFKAPVIGRVSMDLITVDASSLPERVLFPGARVEIIGPTISPAMLAEAAGTIEHEVLIALGRGCKRTYRGG